LIIGTLTTAIVQSSSAVTVLTVSFVNAGLITLEGSLGVIFGANIGTTITAQLVAFKLTYLSPYFLFIGFLFLFFGKRKYVKYIGEALFGFGVLFFGLKLMDDSLTSLKNWTYFRELMISMSKYPLLGILVGAGVTAIIQSSSATTSIVVALANKSSIPITSAIPLILGANIGTCVTALIASIGTRLSAKRTALAHLLFNVIGVTLIFPFLGIFTNLVMKTSLDPARQVANAHTLFNVFWSFIWIWFTKPYAFIVKTLLPGEEKIIYKKPLFLNPLLLDTPTTALEGARKELARMADISEDMFNMVFDSLKSNGVEKQKEILDMEDITDYLKITLINYLTKLSSRPLSEQEAKELNAILRSVDDVERIADHLTNIMEKIEDKISNKVEFSEFAQKELEELRELVYKNMKNAFEMIKETHVSRLKDVLKIEEEIDKLVKELIDNHIVRMKTGVCNPIAGLVFSDILTNLERIGDHSVNIAQNFEEVNLLKRKALVG